MREYAAALQLDPKNFGAHFNSGSSYAALQRWDEAITSYKAALLLRPNDPVVHVVLGEVYASTDRFTEAIDFFKQAVRLDPKVPFVHRTNVRLAPESGHLDEVSTARGSGWVTSSKYDWWSSLRVVLCSTLAAWLA